jgi:hypothetical protein
MPASASRAPPHDPGSASRNSHAVDIASHSRVSGNGFACKIPPPIPVEKRTARGRSRGKGSPYDRGCFRILLLTLPDLVSCRLDLAIRVLCGTEARDSELGTSRFGPGGGKDHDCDEQEESFHGQSVSITGGERTKGRCHRLASGQTIRSTPVLPRRGCITCANWSRPTLSSDSRMRSSRPCWEGIQ